MFYKVGYRVEDWEGTVLKNMAELKVKDDATWVVKKDYEPAEIVSRSLSVVLRGACFWKPMVYPRSVDYSLRKRLMHKPPEGDHALLHELRGFVWRWCVKHLRPLTELKTFDEWLDGSNYTSRQKDKFRDIERRGAKSLDKCVVKCFVKDEEYGEPKAPRMIASREDDAKVVLGPIFKSIEEVLFRLPYFVKHLTPSERVKLLSERFGTRVVYVTDYSSFETHFTRKMMHNCEMVMYRYMLRNFPDAYEKVRVIMGKNRLRSKLFTGTCNAVRMSGEMNTSLGNGFSNLMFMSYACWKQGVELRGIVVEGDDGLVELSRPIPKEFFTRMGLEIKMAEARAYDASFCGCVYNPDTLTNFGHPLDALLKFGWSPTRALAYGDRKIHELTMSKVYSMCAEFPGVPLLWKLCQLCVERLAPVRFCRALKYRDRYWKAEGLSDRWKEPCEGDREYFAELTGISKKLQLEIERDFDVSFPLLRSDALLAFLPDLTLEAWEEVHE